MNNMLKNKQGKAATNIAITLLTIMVLAVIALAVYFIGGFAQTGLGTYETEEGVAPITLSGKPLTLSVKANDLTSSSNAQVAALAYILTDVTEESDKVSGTFSASSGTTLSSSDRTEITKGLTVDGEIWGIATNDTWYGKWTKLTPTTQNEPMDLEVWLITPDKIQISAKDKDENTLVDETQNLTLGANEEETLYEIAFTVNASNRAFNLGAFYIDTGENSNVSSISGSGTTVSSSSNLAGVGYAKTTEGFASTTKDDYVFKLDKPIMMTEWQTVKFKDITVKADGDGCTNNADGDDITIYGVDYNWIKSNKGDYMIFAAETDADSPSDIGATNPTLTFQCGSG